jgi:DNA-directed RNA polymerase subunit beta'
MMREGEPGEGMAFADIGELEHALDAKASSRCTPRSRAASRQVDEDGKHDTEDLRDHAGPHDARRAAAASNAKCRLTCQQAHDQEGHLGMIDTVYRHCGQKETVIFCDRIMALGFRTPSRPASRSARTTWSSRQQVEDRR